MYPIPPSETLVETKTCRHCSVSFPITDKDLEFYEKVSPVFNGKKYSIPTPILCPDCRQQRRLSFRNERKLYKRKCDATGRDIISIYSPDKPFKVYHQDFWWSDKWDPMEHGRDFDFGRGFFEQFGELLREVPKASLSGIGNENCEYTNLLGYSNNCYLSISGDYNEDCCYCTSLDRSNGCVDCSIIEGSDHCYECNDTYTSTKCFYGIDLRNCTDCYFCKNCIGCNFCFGCYELTNKTYCIYNKQVSQEQYNDFLKNESMSSNVFESLKKNIPTSAVKNWGCENVMGDNLNNCHDCYHCFSLKGAESVKYSERGYDGRLSMDVYGLFDVDIAYESNSVGVKSFNILFCNTCWDTLSNLFYCDYCFNGCSHLFGCIGLRNKQYCILNKQYTKEEYEALVPRIIEHMQKTGEWGEFFPSSISPFGYNETVAMEYYPLDPPSPTLPPEGEGSNESLLVSFSPGGKDAGKADRGTFNWSFYEAPFPKVEKIIPADKLPDDISQIPDDILNWAIECEVTKKPFRIIKQELEFYRKHNLPIPRRHPDQRHLDRMALRNPRKLFERKCDKCGVEMITTYSPERPEKVYCGACYDMEVLG